MMSDPDDDLTALAADAQKWATTWLVEMLRGPTRHVPIASRMKELIEMHGYTFVAAHFEPPFTAAYEIEGVPRENWLRLKIGCD